MMEDWEEPTLEEEFAGRMDAADRAVWAEHDAAVRAEETSGDKTERCPTCGARNPFHSECQAPPGTRVER